MSTVEGEVAGPNLGCRGHGTAEIRQRRTARGSPNMQHRMKQYDVWSRPGVVDDYARESHLQPPEETILGVLIRDLHNMDMLDIGVGGGRTTVHFAKLCRRYVGTDISEGMIAACRRRFANWPDSVSFQVSDATNMPEFRDGEFDVVMFSFNGLDCIDPEGRLAALREISRVLKPGGVFIFSAHNTRALPQRMSLTRHLRCTLRIYCAV